MIKINLLNVNSNMCITCSGTILPPPIKTKLKICNHCCELENIYITHK